MPARLGSQAINPGRSSVVRRYPALAFLVASAVLATLLPSALRLPLSGPSAAAELAPVPGKSDASAGDLGGLGESTTGGLGTGSGGDATGRPGGGPLDSDGDPNRGGQLRDKRCVGTPARQTEDPMSPPCVGFFSGDNGGTTAKGVTRDEIRVVIDSCSTGQPDAFVDHHGDTSAARPEVIAYANHFNARFQLYGRTAHFYEARWGTCYRAGDPRRRAQIIDIEERVHPFAIIPLRGANATVGDEAAAQKTITLVDSPPRAFTRERAPYIYSRNPDLEDRMALTAGFICERLAGRPARHSGEVADQDKERRFAVSYRMTGDPDGLGVGMLIDEVGRRCPGTPIKAYPSSSQDAVLAMRTDGVTTIVKSNDDVNEVLYAEGAGWHPEWFVPSVGINNTNGLAYPAAQWRNMFAIALVRKLGNKESQPAVVAAADGCSGCGQYADMQLYEDLLFLFSGMQAAGPRLSPTTFDQGFHALPHRRSLDPRIPAAYMTPGNYSWIKDAMAVWWDATGRPPGSTAVGCFRLIEEGIRYRADDWASSPGDGGIKSPDTSTQPCQGDEFG
jgi:hypothetical protein